MNKLSILIPTYDRADECERINNWIAKNKKKFNDVIFIVHENSARSPYKFDSADLYLFNHFNISNAATLTLVNQCESEFFFTINR